MAYYRKRDPLAWGLILIVLGLMILLHNIDFDIWEFIARLWPLTLIGWGIWKLFFGLKEKRDEKTPPPAGQ